MREGGGGGHSALIDQTDRETNGEAGGTCTAVKVYSL